MLWNISVCVCVFMSVFPYDLKHTWKMILHFILSGLNLVRKVQRYSFPKFVHYVPYSLEE